MTEGEIKNVIASADRFLNRDSLDRIVFQTDVAALFVRRHGHRFRYAHPLGWFVWDGKAWTHDTRGLSNEAVKETEKDLRRQAAELGGDEGDALWKLAKSVGTRRGVLDVLGLAETDPLVRVTTDDLDADPWLLNCDNGTLALRTGELKPHDPDQLLTKRSPAAFDPDAQAPRFETFLAEIQPDPEVRAYLQRLVGYAAIGVAQEHVLAAWWGPGANGKSVLCDVITHVLAGYAKPGPSTLIVGDGKHAPHPTDVASCFGSRLVVVHETKRGASFDASKVKLLTGGDRLTARYMRQDFFEFAPSHTLIMLSNYKPQADANDAAFWRRVQLVPFNVVIPPEKQDRELAEKIKTTEAAGVLRWIVEGALQWQERGLDPPAIILEQTAAYRAAEDVIGRFIEECCVTGKGVKVGGGALYDKFKEWCQDQGERAPRGNEFSAEVQGRGFERKRVRGSSVYLGIGLHASEFEDGGRDG